MRPLAAEAFGTFCLVFAGTGAVVVNDTHGGVVTHVGVALTFGLVVLAMIYAVGDVSGCHLNPAVTLGFLAAGRFEPLRVIPYLACQCLGAVLASRTDLSSVRLLSRLTIRESRQMLRPRASGTPRRFHPQRSRSGRLRGGPPARPFSR